MAACLFAVHCRGIRRSGARPAAGRAGLRRAGAPPAKPKPRPAPKPALAKPAAAAERHEAPAVHEAGGQPKLLGQYAEWGAYTASPGGKKVCFAISKPTSSETNPPNRPRNPVYMFISTRPADKVTNEVSIIIGYPFKPGSEASAQVGSTSFALYTQQDGAWIKNAAEEAQMVDAMRARRQRHRQGRSRPKARKPPTHSI